MTLPTAIVRRLPFRFLQRLGSHGSVRAGQRTLTIPLHDSAALSWIYWSPSWKSALLGRFLRDRPGAFLDIGANIGQTLADFLSLDMGRAYIGVEPNVRCLAYLSEVIASNSLTDTTIIPIGASNQAGLLPLFLQCGSSTDPTASLREDLRPGLQRRVEWINAAPLDDVLSTIKSPPISTVKIDVEGFELEALSGMTRILSTDRPTILCEVLLADAKADLAAYGLRMAALGALLKKHDYQLHRIVISKTGTLESVDAINAFPVGYWSEALKDACDYVFAPVEFSLSGIEAER